MSGPSRAAPTSAAAPAVRTVTTKKIIATEPVSAPVTAPTAPRPRGKAAAKAVAPAVPAAVVENKEDEIVTTPVVKSRRVASKAAASEAATPGAAREASRPRSTSPRAFNKILRRRVAKIVPSVRGLLQRGKGGSAEETAESDSSDSGQETTAETSLNPRQNLHKLEVQHNSSFKNLLSTYLAFHSSQTKYLPVNEAGAPYIQYGDTCLTQADLVEKERAYRSSSKILTQAAFAAGVASAASKPGKPPKVYLTGAEKEARVAQLIEFAQPGADFLAKRFKHVGFGNAALARYQLYQEQRAHPASTRGRGRAGETADDAELSARGVTSCFFVSDQFRDFVMESNFGNGLAMLFPWVPLAIHSLSPEVLTPEQMYDAVAKEVGGDPAEILQIPRSTLLKHTDARHLLVPVFESLRVSTTSLFMMIMNRYVNVNGLALDGELSGQVRVDENLEKFFGAGTDTQYRLRGKTYPAADGVNTSAAGFERLSTVTISPGRGGDKTPLQAYFPDAPVPHFNRKSLNTLACCYRIPNTGDPKIDAVLTAPETRAAIQGISMLLVKVKEEKE